MLTAWLAELPSCRVGSTSHTHNHTHMWLVCMKTVFFSRTTGLLDDSRVHADKVLLPLGQPTPIQHNPNCTFPPQNPGYPLCRNVWGSHAVSRPHTQEGRMTRVLDINLSVDTAGRRSSVLKEMLSPCSGHLKEDKALQVP